jgi:hypothetical protein
VQGDANAALFFGVADLGGSITFLSKHGSVTLNNVTLDLDFETITATPSGSSTLVTLFDLGSVELFPGASTDEITADQVTVDPDGAAYLDSALDNGGFSTGLDLGSLDATWTHS